MADCVSKNGGPDIHKAPPPQVRGTCFLCHFYMSSILAALHVRTFHFARVKLCKLSVEHEVKVTRVTRHHDSQTKQPSTHVEVVLSSTNL